MSAASVAEAIRQRRTQSAWPLAGLLVTGSVALGLALGLLGVLATLFAIVALLLGVALWRRPELSAPVLLGAALTIEQSPFAYGTPGSMTAGTTPSDWTDRLPFFHGLAGGIHLSPADLLLFGLLVIWLLKRGTSATMPVQRSALTVAVGATVCAAAVGVLVGQMHHGELRFAFTEVRPYVYMGTAYFLATVFTTRLEVLRLAMWAIVFGSGFKAAQAFHSYLVVRHMFQRPDFIVAHEEALFFAIFMLLTASLWIFQIDGALRKTATRLLPLVIVADLVNTRRAAWLILASAIVAMTVVIMVAVPARRRFMGRVLVALTLFSIVYFPTFWNHTGALAGPARAVKSATSPSRRDELSDLYRLQENANLIVNIKEGGVLGRGFGLPIDYVLPITDISSIDPLIKFIPHNGVFYIFMRMGLFGAIAFWSLLGTAIITGCRLVRSRNREVAAFGTLLTCALIGYTLEGYNDQGFFLYRVALVMGILMGLAEASRRLQIQADSAFASAAAIGLPAEPARPALAPRRRLTPSATPAGKTASAGRTRREGIVQWSTFVLLAVAVVFFFYLAFAGDKQAAFAPSTEAQTTFAPQPLSSPARAKAVGTPAVTAHSIDLVLLNTGDDSWAEVRQGSPEGQIVYSGVLKTGGRVETTGERIWARFGQASNIAVTLNGRRVPLTGTVDVLFTRHGVLSGR